MVDLFHVKKLTSDFQNHGQTFFGQTWTPASPPGPTSSPPLLARCCRFCRKCHQASDRVGGWWLVSGNNWNQQALMWSSSSSTCSIMPHVDRGTCMFEVTAARMQKRATRKRTASRRWSKRISSWGRERNAIVDLFICNHDLTDNEGYVMDHVHFWYTSILGWSGFCICILSNVGAAPESPVYTLKWVKQTSNSQPLPGEPSARWCNTNN